VSEARTIAHANLALSKYWGKREGGGGGAERLPAVPSLSVTLRGLATRALVRFDASLPDDSVRIGGEEACGEARGRVVELVERVRGAAGEKRRVLVESANDFPTASGLASSASAFAALALAAVRAAGLDWDAARVSALARRSSVSAARSVFGGYVELDAGGESARAVAPPDHMPLAVLVCVTTEERKAIGSTEGMRVTMEKSPYARAWLDAAPPLHAELRAALLARDFERVGELSEASALAMHACAVAAGVVYWNGATIETLAAVRALRAAGTAAYASIDAGPHVKVLVRPDDASRVRASLADVPGVRRILEATPGEGARLEAPCA
jgi:diphosphomevalonate decarboxylase